MDVFKKVTENLEAHLLLNLDCFHFVNCTLILVVRFYYGNNDIRFKVQESVYPVMPYDISEITV